jgi:hypothetical protein
MEYFVKEHRKKQARQQTVDGSAEEKKCVDWKKFNTVVHTIFENKNIKA